MGKDFFLLVCMGYLSYEKSFLDLGWFSYVGFIICRYGNILVKNSMKINFLIIWCKNLEYNWFVWWKD